MKRQERFLAWSIAVLLAAAGSTVPFLSHAGKLYKWVDKDGSVTYQDQPPPGEATVLPGGSDDVSETAGDDATQQAAGNQPVTLFSVPVCESCDLVRMVLEQNQIPFDEKNVQGNVATQKELEAKAGQLTVPVLVIGETTLTGFSISEIHRELASAGYPLAQRRGLQQGDQSPSTDQSGPEELSESEAPTSESRIY